MKIIDNLIDDHLATRMEPLSRKAVVGVFCLDSSVGHEASGELAAVISLNCAEEKTMRGKKKLLFKFHGKSE